MTNSDDQSTSTESLPPAAIDMDQQSLGEAFSSLQRLLHYSASLPDSLRSAGAFATEKVRESASWLVPSAFRNSQSYSVFVQQMFEYVSTDWVASWRGDSSEKALISREETSERDEQVFLARKAVGSLLDMTALATFHFCPLTVLAIYAEHAYGSNQYIQLLGQRLKEQGIVLPTTFIEDTNSLVIALGQAAEIATSMFDQPPLSPSGLRRTIDQILVTVAQFQVDKLLPHSEIDQLWRQMELAARDQHASIWDISATISIVSLNKLQAVDEGGFVSLEFNGNMFQKQIIDHYWEALRAIERHGLLPTFSRASQPYVETVWSNYAVDRKTWTEQLLSGELIKWGWSQLSWPKLGRIS